jgi:FdhD protein
MPLAKALCTNPITRIDGPARREVRDDVLAVEEPLEIRVAGRSVAVVMRTPGHDRELAAGFLVTEGLVRERDDVLDMIYCGHGAATSSSRVERGAGAASPNVPRENVLDVVLAPGVDVDFARLSRNVFTSSSCGICSKASIEAVRREFAPLAAPVAPSRAVIAALPEKLRAAQAVFAATGGLHASALFTTGGELVVAREDVGRHNALDKVIGHAFFAGRLPLAGHLLCVSGRVSFEIMQKALAGGIAVVAAISAPTSAAVELARESGQTLVGFVRGERMNVYAGTLAD